MVNMIEITLTEDYQDKEVPTCPDIYIKVGEGTNGTQGSVYKVELADATLDPLRIINGACNDYGEYNVSVPASVVSVIFNHPLVQYYWDTQKFTWVKEDGIWRKTIHVFKGGDVLNFQGIDWFM